MSSRSVVLIVGGLTLLVCQAFAAPVLVPIPGIQGTGVGLAEGAQDTSFLLIAAPAGVPTGVHPVVIRTTVDYGDGNGLQPAFPFWPGTWIPDTAAGKWVGVGDRYSAATRYGYGPADPAGMYVFEVQFTLTPTATGGHIWGTWSADNRAVITLNGVEVARTPTGCWNAPSPNCYQSSYGFDITSSFVAGVNHLQFVVENEVLQYGNPVGLWVDMRGEVWDVPEPSTIILGCAGLAALMALRRRKRA